MDTIFTLGDFDDNEDVKVNLDDLYERKKQHDLNTLRTYNRILNRINNKIKTVSRIASNEQFCWYVIPEHIIGVPRFDKEACTAFVISKLKDNGFYAQVHAPKLALHLMETLGAGIRPKRDKEENWGNCRWVWKQGGEK